MTVEERAERAARLKNFCGRNCCQAVTEVLADETTLTVEQLSRLASGFAVGMGTMEATCGALIGASMAAGARLGTGSVRQVKQISQCFKQLCGGATICRELKGVGTGNVLCACDDCVRNAVRAYYSVMG